MKTLRLGVVLLVLAGAGAAQAGRVSLGFWEGQRDVGYLYYYSFFVSSISALEGGAYCHWDVADNLGLRFQAAYLKGSISNSETDVYRNSEYKYELTGFPVQLQVLPTARVGDRLILRAGAGLTYYKLTGKGYNVSGSTTTGPAPAWGHGLWRTATSDRRGQAEQKHRVRGAVREGHGQAQLHLHLDSRGRGISSDHGEGILRPSHRGLPPGVGVPLLGYSSHRKSKAHLKSGIRRWK